MFNISRHDEVSKLIEAGLTYAEIGRRLDISRQRAWQIVKGKPKSTPQPKVMLTTGDVAQSLGVHISTVRYWTNKGILKLYRFGSRGHRRFQREDIDTFSKSRNLGGHWNRF